MKTLQKITLLFVSSILLFSCESNNENENSNCNNQCDYSIASGETAGTVPSSLNGTYVLTYTDYSNGSNTYYANASAATFTIANNTLTIEADGKDCITITNPIQTSASENTFKNTCGTNIMYAVSVTSTGELNEINVSGINNNFLGQFTE